MLQDLRHGIRVLLQAKGWTSVVVLSLAVGIAANTAIFTAVNGLVLQKLPVRDADSLVRLRWAGKNDMANDTSDYGSTAPTSDGQPVGNTFSYPMFQHFRAANQTMTDLAASRPGGVTVVIDGHAETASALMATGNYHSLLGVTAHIGRTLTPGADKGWIDHSDDDDWDAVDSNRLADDVLSCRESRSPVAIAKHRDRGRRRNVVFRRTPSLAASRCSSRRSDCSA